MLSTDGGGTHWFQAWHRTRPPGVRWPGTETGSGLCGSPWTTSVCSSLQSRCLSATLWTGHLRDTKEKTQRSETGLHLTMQRYHLCDYATDRLHGVPLLDKQLGSGDVDVHSQRLRLLVHRVWRPRVLAEEINERHSLSFSCVLLHCIAEMLIPFH